MLNVPKIKGSSHRDEVGHDRRRSAVRASANGRRCPKWSGIPERLRHTWLWDELHSVRNIRPAFRWGLLPALAYSALDTYVLRGKAPWTLHQHADHTQLKTAAECTPIAYPKPDGKLTFDRLSSVFISNTNHEEDQRAHLQLKDSVGRRST